MRQRERLLRFAVGMLAASYLASWYVTLALLHPGVRDLEDEPSDVFAAWRAHA